MKSRRLQGIALYCVGIALLSAAAALLASGPHRAHSYLPLVLWGGLLLVLDGLNAATTGRSPLLDEPDQVLGWFALSIPWWLCFELLNLRLGFWSYQGLPAAAPLRWTGYALAFGAVLPALAEARQLLTASLPLRSVEVSPFRVTDGIRDALRGAGAAFLALALIWPETCYPLAFAAPFLLLEPSLSRLAPLASSLFELGLGSAEILLGWASSGLLCGVLWQVGNWWAGGRWTHLTLAAAVPFALSSAAAVGLATYYWPRLSMAQRAATIFALSTFSAIMFAVIDAHTLKG